jgi:hypothetical protein
MAIGAPLINHRRKTTRMAGGKSLTETVLMNGKKPIIPAILIFACVSSWLVAQDQKPVAPALGKGILDVVVIDEEGKPLPGAAVSVPGYRSTTGLGGTCRFGLLPGRYAVLVSKNGYRGRRVNAGVRPGETTTTRIMLQKLPTARSAQK